MSPKSAGSAEVKGVTLAGQTLTEEKGNHKRLGMISMVLYRWECIDHYSLTEEQRKIMEESQELGPFDKINRMNSTSMPTSNE